MPLTPVLCGRRWSKGAKRMTRMGYWRYLQVQGTVGSSERNFGVLRFQPILRYSIGNASGKGILQL